MPGEVGGTSCRDFAGVVPASRGAHRRPLHPGLASLCSARTDVETYLLSDADMIAGFRRGPVRRAQAQEEVVQVEIGSGTQVASRGPTWRIATPRY